MKRLLLTFLLCLPSALSAQHSRLLLWEQPPLIGMYTLDSARVDDTLSSVATADWPAFADTALAELRECTKIHGGAALEGWTLRTVAAPAFRVRVFDRDEKRWRDDLFYIGWTFPSVKRIYVVQQGLFVRGLVKHEMLHALLTVHGFDPRHGTPVSDGMFKRCFPEAKSVTTVSLPGN